MKILVMDSHGSHASVVKTILSLGAFDIFYGSDTRSAPYDELSGFTRVSRLLTLFESHRRSPPAVVVLLGGGMSSPLRDAVDFGARRAGIELIHAVDLLADDACTVFRPGGLCFVGNSCLTEADVRGRLARDPVVPDHAVLRAR